MLPNKTTKGELPLSVPPVNGNPLGSKTDSNVSNDGGNPSCTPAVDTIPLIPTPEVDSEGIPVRDLKKSRDKIDKIDATCTIVFIKLKKLVAWACPFIKRFLHYI
jgi:hypothetical protein